MIFNNLYKSIGRTATSGFAGKVARRMMTVMWQEGE
jgi:hypothetical protein